MIQFRDHNYSLHVEKPAIIYSVETKSRVKHGELIDMMEFCDIMKKKYIDAGFPNYADDLAVLELPQNQELIDELFQSSGKLQQFIEKYVH